MNRIFSDFLDCSRWVAAFLVVIGHARQWSMVDYADLHNRTFMWKVWYGVTGLGHEAVVIFFVISGYLVGGLTVKRMATHGYDATRFWTHRFSRIYTVLVPALIAGALLDLAGEHLNISLYSLTTPWARAFNVPALQALTPASFFGNLLMVQTILVPTFGTNGPLWSLAYEWWYYVIFACAAHAYATTGIGRIVSVLTAGLLIFILPPKIVYSGALWLVGLLIAVYGPVFKLRIRPAIAFLVFGLALSVSRFGRSDALGGMFTDLSYDLVVAVGYGALLIALMKCKEDKDIVSNRVREMNFMLSNFSYTTYLVHYPALVFVMSTLSYFGVVRAGPAGITTIAFTFALTAMLLMYCFVFSHFTERHTPRVRKLLQRLSQRYFADA